MAAAATTKDTRRTAWSYWDASLAGQRRFIHLSNFAGQKMPGAGQFVTANFDGTPCCQRLNDKVQSLFRGRNSPLRCDRTLCMGPVRVVGGDRVYGLGESHVPILAQSYEVAQTASALETVGPRPVAL
jgi:hypothetical protein